MVASPSPLQELATPSVNRILVIDDEPALARLLNRILTATGYQVTEAGTGAAGLRAVTTVDPDLVILDLMLPDRRGQDVLADLMVSRPDSRVLVLSSVTQIAPRVAVLEQGAADFLAKPFANAELVARVRARIRTPSAAAEASVDSPRFLRGAGVVVDVERREMTVNGRRVVLTQREFVLLSYLLQRSPEACTRAELLERVWGTTFDAGTNVVDVYVKRLRWKLANNKIETVRNVGYRLTG
jgi:DNA-binding response OmpR family regulator